MHPLETYLEELSAIRSSGAAVKETSGYGPLANLFNSIGQGLKPKVRCFIHVKNSGAGLPDGGLFTPDQLKNTDEEAPLLGIPLPSRGVIEVKATDADVNDVAGTKQVREYVKLYGLALVTNYRNFLLLKRGDNGSPLRLESFQLALDEKTFWQLAAQPRKAANDPGERFAEYIKRVLLHAAPLNNPKDVAFFLASYARDARSRVEATKDLPQLAAVRIALEEALGMKFEAEKGEHFFRSTLVQTLFYGVFSAWVLWHKEKPLRNDAFDWKSAAWTLHVPMIKALFEQVAAPTKLGPLGLVEVLDWTAAALNRVDRAAFFERFVEDHAVQYFYEPFLEAFDPELRKQLGVWYTPPEIVQYQVARVDTALREELDIPDGLADPPYNGFAGLAVEEERDLSNAYRTTKRAPAPQGQGLNDLYIRFFRMAERRIVEKSGEGIVSFISNYSWLDGLSFTGMREKYLEVFDGITVDCLNGDKFKTGKLTPEGEPDPSIFSTEANREGIQVGTAIATLIRRSRREDAQTSKKKSQKPVRSSVGEIQFRHLWGKNKRGELLATLKESPKKIYSRLKPPLEVGLAFLPMKTESGYYKWPLLTELLPVSFPGVKTSRDDFLVDVEKDALIERLEKYFDPEISHEEMKRLNSGVMVNSARFSAESVRDELRKRGFLKKNVVRYCYRPFDIRWLYWEPETKLLDEKRTDYFLQVFEGNIWLSAGQRNRKEDFYQPQFMSILADHHIVESNVGMFPLWLKQNPDPSSLFDRVSDGKPKANLTDAAKEYLADLRLANKPEGLFYHVLTVLHSPNYCAENSGALRQDWPRVPLPKLREALLVSAELGKQVAALLDVETPLDGVTKGRPRPELKEVAELKYSGEADLRITAGWGHAGQNGVTMPGKGKIITSDLDAGPDNKLPWLKFHDVYLNESACWKNIPAPVWDYTIGGYQVIKKWLSYREFELLGRPLTPDEAREVTHMARRIAALILLQPELDANYERVKTAVVSLKPDAQ